VQTDCLYNDSSVRLNFIMKTNSELQILAMALGICLGATSTIHAQDFFPVATNSSDIEIGGGGFRDGTNYVVGYVSGSNILAQRITPGGQLFGGRVSIASGVNPGFPPAVAIAAGRTNGLVVWSDLNSRTGVTIFGRIWAVNTGPVGTSFPLLSAVGSHGIQIIQAAASDGTNFLAVWRDDTQNNTYGQLVTANGTLSGSEFLISGVGSADLALLFGKTNYLIAWQSGSNSNHNTFIRTISKSGAVGSQVQINTTSSLDRNPTAIGFDGTNFLVVWNRSLSENPGGWPNFNLCGRFVSQNGTPLGTELTLVTEQAAFPALAFDGNNYLLLWSYNGDTTNRDVAIHARFFNRSGTPIGPIFTPFAPRGNYPPLLPLNGAFFSGTQFLLSATYGAFVFDGNGDVVGFNGGDVHGRFLPKSTTPPEFLNPIHSNGHFGGQIKLVPGINYVASLSTNLADWKNEGIVNSDATNLLSVLDRSPMTGSRMFYRFIAGFTTGPAFDFWLMEFAYGGSFGSGYTPQPSYPVILQNYAAKLYLANDYPPASPASVLFTGPAGSGLTNAPSDGFNSWIDEFEAVYQSPQVSNPATAPGGTWRISYKGTNLSFNVPDPQAAARLVLPLPTVTVSGGILLRVNWAYKNPTTGATLPSPPTYITGIQVQIDGTMGNRIYDSDEYLPTVTSHVLTEPISWSDVQMLHMAYDDTLGNHYVISFSRQ